MNVILVTIHVTIMRNVSIELAVTTADVLLDLSVMMRHRNVMTLTNAPLGYTFAVQVQSALIFKGALIVTVKLDIQGMDLRTRPVETWTDRIVDS